MVTIHLQQMNGFVSTIDWFLFRTRHALGYFNLIVRSECAVIPLERLSRVESKHRQSLMHTCSLCLALCRHLRKSLKLVSVFIYFLWSVLIHEELCREVASPFAANVTWSCYKETRHPRKFGFLTIIKRTV